MVSYGKYTEDQLTKLKARCPELIGHMRHYDEIVSHSANRHVVRGVIADRGFENAIQKKDFQTIDGKPWGWDDVEVVRAPFRFSKTATSFPLGAHPPGYHLPQWTVEKNPDFEPIPRYNVVSNGLNGISS